MRRRNLIFGLLAVAATVGAHAEQSKKAQRIAIVYFVFGEQNDRDERQPGS